MCQIFVAFSEYLNFKKYIVSYLRFKLKFSTFLVCFDHNAFTQLFTSEIFKKNPFFYKPYQTWWILLRTWELIEADHEVLKYFDVFQFAARSQFVTQISIHLAAIARKVRKKKKVRAFEQMFQSHNSTGIPKFVNANRLNQNSTATCSTLILKC